MELTVTGRHVQVSERFRRLCAEKLTKVEQYAPRTQRIEVVVSEETSRGAPKGSERVEITCLAKGPVIRAEAYAEDRYAGLDLALAKLSERLRRAGDRRKVSKRRGNGHAVAAPEVPVPTAPASPAPEPVETDVDPASKVDERLGSTGDCPIQVREKTHRTAPMTMAQALDGMELVGHDFFLYHDAETGQPSVVYRRRGWEYGVIHLDVVAPEDLAHGHGAGNGAAAS